MECTEDHPILTPTGYRMANNLQVGSSVICIGLDYYPEISHISSKEIIVSDVDIPVYDIEVPGYHNFVLSSSFIVHNSKDILDSVAANIFKAGMQEAPPIVQNTVNDFIDINDVDDSEDLEDWILPSGITVIDTNNHGLFR